MGISGVKTILDGFGILPLLRRSMILIMRLSSEPISGGKIIIQKKIYLKYNNIFRGSAIFVDGVY